MKKLITAIFIVAATSVTITMVLFNTPAPSPNAVIINDVVMTILADTDDAAIFLDNQLTYAFNEMDTARLARDRNVKAIIYMMIAIFFVLTLTLVLHCHYTILRPFNNLQSFAQKVAAGELDTPLDMDKSNRFGAFTESFDIMREELHKSNTSKKELVASLSHDIKTPIASIKAVTELMLVKTTCENQATRLHTIFTKAEQIDALITNMFNATLEELQVLDVTTAEVASTQIAKLIEDADYQGQATVSPIPSCLVVVDVLRLQQVFDNVINNAYKYANTSVNIFAEFIDGFLVINIQDFGEGLQDNELLRIFDKYYRGANKGSANGQGLGLFVSKYFMLKMGGDIKCTNNSSGFLVQIFIRIA